MCQCTLLIINTVPFLNSANGKFGNYASAIIIRSNSTNPVSKTDNYSLPQS